MREFNWTNFYPIKFVENFEMFGVIFELKRKASVPLGGTGAFLFGCAGAVQRTALVRCSIR